MKLKQIVFICITLVCIVVTVILLNYNSNNNYVLKVNGEKITQAEFETYLEMSKKYFELSTGAEIEWNELNEIEGVPNIDIAKDYTKTLVVGTKIQLQEAKKRNVFLTEEEKNNIALSISSDSDIITTYDNLTVDELIKLQEENFIIEKLALDVVKENLHYDARHILFNTQEMTEEQKLLVKNTAQSVLDRIKNGEEFSVLASEFSEDPGSKDNGGLYTVIAKGAFVSEFEEAALSLEEGDLYPELVESSYGYHIIKLEKLNSEITELTGDLYNEFLMKVQDWIDEAEVEEGSQYYLVGVEYETNENDENNENNENNEKVLPDESEPDSSNTN